MKILNLILVLTLALIVVGCQEVVIEDGDEDLNPDSSMEEEEESETEPSESQENEDESLGCEGNSDCTGNEVCIDNECGTVAQLYKTEGCQETCNFNNVNITTSDDQSFTLSRGKGSYTAAGALEWKIVTGPDYCSGEDIIVPLRIIKKKNFYEKEFNKIFT